MGYRMYESVNGIVSVLTFQFHAILSRASSHVELKSSQAQLTVQ